jgi:hypothetical protein
MIVKDMQALPSDRIPYPGGVVERSCCHYLMCPVEGLWTPLDNAYLVRVAGKNDHIVR